MSLLTFNSSWKSDNYEESYQGKQQRTDTKKEAKRVIILQDTIEESPILLSQYWKHDNLTAPKLFAFWVLQYYFC